MAASKRRRVTVSDLDHRMRELDDRMHGQGIILEEIRSQNRATIEAVEAARVALDAKLDRVDRDSRARDALLEAAVRQNGADIRKNSEDIRKNSADIRKNSADIRTNSDDIRKNSDDIRKNSEDIGVLTVRVDALGPLDQRMSALERRSEQG